MIFKSMVLAPGIKIKNGPFLKKYIDIVNGIKYPKERWDSNQVQYRKRLFFPLCHNRRKKSFSLPSILALFSTETFLLSLGIESLVVVAGCFDHSLPCYSLAKNWIKELLRSPLETYLSWCIHLANIHIPTQTIH